MTTLLQMIAETRYHLITGDQEKYYYPAGAVGAGDTTITLSSEAQGIIPGQTLGIDLEEVLVKDVTGDTLTLIARGFNGSTAATHDGNSIIRKRFTDYRILTFLNRALEDLSADGLFRVKFVEFTYNPTVYAYNLNAADLIDVWRVRYDEPGPSQVWPEIPKRLWHIDQDANPVDFPNNKSIILEGGGFPGHLVRVSYKAGFSPHTANYAEDTLATTGLHAEAHKLPPLGAAIYLLGGRDVKRTFLHRQPEPRRQEEVPPNSGQQAMRPIMSMYLDDLKRERRRLRRRYPDAL